VIHLTPVYGNGEQGQDVHQLNMERFYGVDGRDRKRRGLFVLVMELVKVTVKERYVVNPVHPICHIILKNHKALLPLSAQLLTK
jgi:hypothetical protein